MPRATGPAVQADEIGFAYKGGPAILDIAHFQLERGERLFLRGPSGSGKSTLLGLIAGVLPVQSGKLNVLGENMERLSSQGRDHLRARDMGVIFQMFNLVPYLPVIENVTLPLRFSKERRARLSRQPAEEARTLLARLGLEDERLLKQRVSDLSTGQQQRVAAARALIGSPGLIVADEPTSALDAQARARFIDLLAENVGASGASLLFVSHDGALARHFDRTLDLEEINRAGTMAT
jgi:putative ABC transport system ATP-binding protein